MFLKDTTIKIPTSDRIIRTIIKIIKTTVNNNDNDYKDSLHNNNFDNINKNSDDYYNEYNHNLSYIYDCNFDRKTDS